MKVPSPESFDITFGCAGEEPHAPMPRGSPRLREVLEHSRMLEDKVVPGWSRASRAATAICGAKT